MCWHNEPQKFLVICILQCNTNVQFHYLVPALHFTDRQYEERSVSRRDSSYQGWDKSKIYCKSFFWISSTWLITLFQSLVLFVWHLIPSPFFLIVMHEILLCMNFVYACYLWYSFHEFLDISYIRWSTEKKWWVTGVQIRRQTSSPYWRFGWLKKCQV